MTDDQLPSTPESPPDPVPDPAPGASLRKVREQAGISLRQVGERTLIPLARLEALEQDRYDAVGSSAYVTGYARAYARAIGTPPDPIVAAFEAALARQKQRELDLESAPVSRSVDWPDHRGKLWLASMATAVMMGVVLTLLLLYRLGGADGGASEAGRTETPPAPVTSPAPRERAPSMPRAVEPLSAEPNGSAEPPPNAGPLSAPEPRPEAAPQITSGPQESAPREQIRPAPTPTPRPVPTEPRVEQVLEMSFTHECWVEVHDANGERILARLAQSGDNLQLRGQAPFEVLLGDARAANLSLDGEPITLSPRPGRNTLRLQVGP